MVATTIPLSSTLIDLRVVWRAPPQWCVLRADWPTFQANVNLSEGELLVWRIWQLILTLQYCKLRALQSPSRQHPFVPWWNLDCSRAVGARKKALARLKHYPTADNPIDYKWCRAKARRTILESKNASWKAYVSSLNCHTPPRLVWRKVRPN